MRSFSLEAAENEQCHCGFVLTAVPILGHGPCSRRSPRDREGAGETDTEGEEERGLGLEEPEGGDGVAGGN